MLVMFFQKNNAMFVKHAYISSTIHVHKARGRILKKI